MNNAFVISNWRANRRSRVWLSLAQRVWESRQFSHRHDYDDLVRGERLVLALPIVSLLVEHFILALDLVNGRSTTESFIVR